MLLTVPMALLYPKVATFFVSLPKLFEALKVGDWRSALIWLLDSEVVAVWALVVLAVALVWKKWFEPGFGDRKFVFAPLYMLAFNAFLTILGYKLVVQPENYFETFKTAFQAYFDLRYMCLSPLESLTAPVSSVDGFAYQPFAGPFPKRFRVSVLGCFLLVFTVVLPNFVAMRHLIFSVVKRDHMDDNFTLVLIICSLVCSSINCFYTSTLNGNPPLCTKNKLYWPSLSVLLAPCSFFYLLKSLSLMDVPTEGLSWLFPFDTVWHFSIVYLVMGVIASAGYCSDPRSFLGKSFRAFYKAIDAKDAKDIKDDDEEIFEDAVDAGDAEVSADFKPENETSV